MGKVHAVRLIVEVDAGDGVLTRYEVNGRAGTTWGRRTRMTITPHYGNPGMPATQVEVHMDAMLVPLDNEQLVSITEHPLPDSPGHELPMRRAGGNAAARAIGQVLPISESPSGAAE